MRIGFEAKRIFHNNTGLGNYGRDVIRILSEYTDISAFFLYNTKPSQKKGIKTSNKIIVRYPEGGFWKKLSTVWRLGPVVKQIAKDNIDVYHGLSGEIPFGLHKKNIATVVTIHDLIFFSHPNYYSFFDRIIYSIKSKHAAINSDRIIAISKQTKRDIIKYLHIDEEKINVVYQGCNAAFKVTYDESIKEEKRKKYGLPQEFILNVGTIQERKNALTIVKAIQGTNYHLVLVGNDKRYVEKIRAYIKKYRLYDQVTFLKNIDVKDLAIIYQLTTVFCYPSICEGFGIPIIEALFSKAPVITSRGNCFPEAGGANSIYVDPLDVDALRQQFHQLFQNQEKREEMAKKGYAFAQKFSDEKVAHEIFEVYKSMLK